VPRSAPARLHRAVSRVRVFSTRRELSTCGRANTVLKVRAVRAYAYAHRLVEVKRERDAPAHQELQRLFQRVQLDKPRHRPSLSAPYDGQSGPKRERHAGARARGEGGQSEGAVRVPSPVRTPVIMGVRACPRVRAFLSHGEMRGGGTKRRAATSWCYGTSQHNPGGIAPPDAPRHFEWKRGRKAARGRMR
jgi:hypothetical protein